MDVVALAQHGVDYAVATLGTATTPVARAEAVPADRHASSSASTATPRAARPRGARSRTRCRCSPTARTRGSCSCPTARIPTTSCASAARRRSRRCSHGATPLSEFLLAELVGAASADLRRGPRGAGRRRAPLSRADRRAPVLAALLRRRLAELTGLAGDRAARRCSAPRGERAPAGAGARRRARRDRARAARRPRAARGAPSLVRELIQGLLLQPALARSHRHPAARRRHAGGRRARARWSSIAARRPRAD